MQQRQDAYQKLCQQVEKIDAKAAQYLRCNAIKLKSFTPGESLWKTFTWDDTEQGHEYWLDLSRKLRRMPDKDYMVIADSIRIQLETMHTSWGPTAKKTVHRLTRQLAVDIAAHNPNFNKQKFLEAALGKEA